MTRSYHSFANYANKVIIIGAYQTTIPAVELIARSPVFSHRQIRKG
jgi:hypothetical protein